MNRSAVEPLGVIVKFVSEVAVPPGVETEMGPVVAVGTVAVICVGLLIVKAAPAPLNATSNAKEKFVPVITTEAPTWPDVGLNPEMVGGGDVTMNGLVDVAVPPGVVTAMNPEVVAGTVAVI